ncbi:cytochrome c [Telmatospirillum sp.]|uniref:c-type cytochrome n=1 Tax=Telmatospirillum sp. TaxID=2079197 RepID=UPI00284AD35F|nr:cytochrome c [Telmatospirillum sp.]MDR3435574.1 cytochrome c [Telmatospirillum sp.]
MLRQSIILAAFAAGLFGVTGTAFAADAAAGNKAFEQACSSCHEVGDWKGKSATDLTTMIQDVVSGKTAHKKAIKLTDAQIADIVAFLTAPK